MFGNFSRRHWFRGLLGVVLGVLGLGARWASQAKDAGPSAPSRSRMQSCTIDPPGPVTICVYDASGNLISVTDTHGSTTSIVYDGKGQHPPSA
jgi:RHS Repeat